MYWTIYILGLLVIAGIVGYNWDELCNSQDFEFELGIICFAALLWPLLFGAAVVIAPFALVGAAVYYISKRFK